MSKELLNNELDNVTSLKTTFVGSLQREDPGRRRIIEQIKVYLLTYIGYSLIHWQREFWSMAKTIIKESKESPINDEVLS